MANKSWKMESVCSRGTYIGSDKRYTITVVAGWRRKRESGQSDSQRDPWFPSFFRWMLARETRAPITETTNVATCRLTCGRCDFSRERERDVFVGRPVTISFRWSAQGTGSPADPPQLCDTTTFCCNNIRAFTTTARPLRREIHSATIILHVWPSQWCSNFSHRYRVATTLINFLFRSKRERERERSIRAVQRVYLIRYRVNYQRSSIRIDNDNIILTCKLISPMPATRSNRERVILNTFESKEGRKEVPLQVPLNFKEAIFRGECKRSREMKRT